MDIYCGRCGEPWDIDSLHDVPGRSFDSAFREFKRIGCLLFGKSESCVPNSSERAMISRALLEVCGDDIDGVAADMEGL